MAVVARTEASAFNSLKADARSTRTGGRVVSILESLGGGERWRRGAGDDEVCCGSHDVMADETSVRRTSQYRERDNCSAEEEGNWASISSANLRAAKTDGNVWITSSLPMDWFRRPLANTLVA